MALTYVSRLPPYSAIQGQQNLFNDTFLFKTRADDQAGKVSLSRRW